MQRDPQTSHSKNDENQRQGKSLESRRRKMTHCKGTPLRLTGKFSSETREARRQLDNKSNVLSEEPVNQESCIQKSCLPKMKVEKRP